MRVVEQQRIQTACLLVLTTIAGAATLYWLKPVLIPFVLAIFFSLCLTPVIDFQHRRLHIRRSLAAMVTIIIGCIILALLWGVVSASVSQLSTNTGKYQEEIGRLLDQVIGHIPLERLGVEPEEFTSSLLNLLQQAARRIVAGTLRAIMSVLSNGLLVMIFMIFIMLGQTTAGAPAGGLRGEIERRVKRYILTKVLISIVTGFCIGLTLNLMGVEFAFFFGVFAFLLNFIPSIGSMIATLLPIPVVVLNPELSVATQVLAVVIPGALQILIGNIIEPKILGESLDLHPITILMALIFFGMIWGVVGMLLATPMVAVLRIMCGRIEATQPIAELMGGRTDALSTYFRTLEAPPAGG